VIRLFGRLDVTRDSIEITFGHRYVQSMLRKLGLNYETKDLIPILLDRSAREKDRVKTRSASIFEAMDTYLARYIESESRLPLILRLSSSES